MSDPLEIPDDELSFSDVHPSNRKPSDDGKAGPFPVDPGQAAGRPAAPQPEGQRGPFPTDPGQGKSEDPEPRPQGENEGDARPDARTPGTPDAQKRTNGKAQAAMEARERARSASSGQKPGAKPGSKGNSQARKGAADKGDRKPPPRRWNKELAGSGARPSSSPSASAGL